MYAFRRFAVRATASQNSVFSSCRSGAVRSSCFSRACAPVLFSSQAASQQQDQDQGSERERENRDFSDSEPSAGFRKGIRWWLLACAGCVGGVVAMGGLTRLTGSGLSMVDWRVQGYKYPSSDEEWESVFARYKQFPEFQTVNNEMSLQMFKFIYFMEYAHRMLARGVGVLFGVPFAGLMLASRTFRQQRWLVRSCTGLLALGACQGLVGWWMVKSGLDQDNLRDTKRELRPRVDPIRLATHLSMALLVYGGLVATAIRVGPRSGKKLGVSAAIKLTSALGLTTCFTTMELGALVAGNDAGKVYDEWPTMGGPGRYIPGDLYRSDWSLFRNLTEHETMVQFNHRIAAYATVAFSAILFALTRRMPAVIRTPATAVFHATMLQALLGITTLLRQCPIPESSAHQMNALLLYSCYIWLCVNSFRS